LDWSIGIPIRVVDGGDYQRPSQGFLFRGNGGDYILIYALETGQIGSPSGNNLYMRRSSTISALENAPDQVVEPSLKIPQDGWSRFRTVYAAQDSAGNIHLVWQDASNAIKWCVIDIYTGAIGPTSTIAVDRWLDSIAVGDSRLYVSVLNSLSPDNTAEILEVDF
jgi:hypothetical protein